MCFIVKTSRDEHVRVINHHTSSRVLLKGFDGKVFRFVGTYFSFKVSTKVLVKYFRLDTCAIAQIVISILDYFYSTSEGGNLVGSQPLST